jgi:hypothetical protein
MPRQPRDDEPGLNNFDGLGGRNPDYRTVSAGSQIPEDTSNGNALNYLACTPGVPINFSATCGAASGAPTP